MGKFQLPDEIREKFERAAHLRWVDPRDEFGITLDCVPSREKQGKAVA
jgi:hypothetical protein